MSKSLKRVRTVFEDAGIKSQILEMPGETRTAADAARELKCEIGQIAKSIIFRGETSGGVVLFITAGGNQVDPLKAAVVANKPLGRADAAFVRAKTGFAIGGDAPIGHVTAPTDFYDPRLSDFAEIYAAAGTPRRIFSILPEDLLRIEDAQPADFTS